MCPKAAQLYQAWVALVPQIQTGHKEQLHLMKQTTPESERARLAYEKHRSICQTCRDEHIDARQYLAQFGLEPPNGGKPLPEEE